jgi:hypothetical protein
MRLYEVHLCTPNVPGSFTVPIRAESEHEALARALCAFPMCYVDYTKEVSERSILWRE